MFGLASCNFSIWEFWIIYSSWVLHLYCSTENNPIGSYKVKVTIKSHITIIKYVIKIIVLIIKKIVRIYWIKISSFCGNRKHKLSVHPSFKHQRCKSWHDLYWIICTFYPKIDLQCICSAFRFLNNICKHWCCLIALNKDNWLHILLEYHNNLSSLMKILQRDEHIIVWQQ